MWKKYTKKKYGNITCKCLSGHIHDSRLEAGFCDVLLADKKDGKIKEFYSQVNFELRVEGKKICGHRVDFVAEDFNGKKTVYEVKGYATDVWHVKMKLFKAIYPNIPYIVVSGGKSGYILK